MLLRDVLSVEEKQWKFAHIARQLYTALGEIVCWVVVIDPCRRYDERYRSSAVATLMRCMRDDMVFPLVVMMNYC